MEFKNLLTYLRINEKVALLAIISISAMTLLFFRILATQHFAFLFLTWNLFLAWIPLLFIRLVWEKEKLHLSPFWLLSVYFVIWLLFFPNAPYIITDLKHLRAVSEDILWFDALMLFMFAVSGFLTGLYSIRIVHRIITQRWNQSLA